MYLNLLGCIYKLLYKLSSSIAITQQTASNLVQTSYRQTDSRRGLPFILQVIGTTAYKWIGNRELSGPDVVYDLVNGPWGSFTFFTRKVGVESYVTPHWHGVISHSHGLFFFFMHLIFASFSYYFVGSVPEL